ncbi:hypothetical protein SAMN05216188_13141 [Lentzea xinjiangensis]|uniref:Uncharacterized protein n=1 Tax=Lentzea xinjiangensis TaxID=402600 RepID=A0A1H9W849_9PSEU|nr:DUF3188 domain-containing protein [Lentzea xinjiangensis]SES30068.1 hypothetical protein SAMN05216188_13141 [Lentzea xinjiangensis]
MDEKLRWTAPGLVLLAVVAVLATTVTEESPLTAVLVVLAIGLLVAGYALRFRNRTRQVHRRDDEPRPSVHMR